MLKINSISKNILFYWYKYIYFQEGFKPPLTGFKLDDFDNGLILDGDLEYLKDGKLKAWIKLKEFPSNIKVSFSLF